MPRHPQLLTLVLAALLSFAVGCGKTKTDAKKTGDGGNGKETKTTGKPMKERLVGTWTVTMKIDDEKALAQMKKDMAKDGIKLTDEQMKKQLAAAKSMFEESKMTVTINADGTSSSTMEITNPKDAKKPLMSKSEQSTWELLTEDGDKATVKITPTEGRRKDKPTEYMITFVDDMTFTVDDAKGEDAPPGTMTFKKK